MAAFKASPIDDPQEEARLRRLPRVGKRFRLFKDEHVEKYAGLLPEVLKNIQECLIRRVDQFGEPASPEWKVQGSDTSALFKTKTAAIEFIIKATVAAAVLDDDNKHGRPNGMGGGAMDSEHPSERLTEHERQANFPGALLDDMDGRVAATTGTSSPLSEDTVNADPNLAREQKKPNWYERHKYTGPMIDGVRQP